MSIKLTITGASGVGKTKLAESLSTALGIPLIPEMGRVLCAELGYERIGEVPDQENFKQLALKRQIAEETKLDSFIADRSVIDCWVLWQRWNICSAMTYDTEALYSAVVQHVSNYTHIVYLPPMFPAQEDGFRWTEPDYIKQIDRIIAMTFYDLQLWDKVLKVSSTTIEDRINEVQNWTRKKS